MNQNKNNRFTTFQTKIMWRFCGNALLSLLVVAGLYLFLWKRRLGDVTVSILEHLFHIPHENAFMIYHSLFREHKDFFLVTATILVFLLLLWSLFRWISRYFREINEGIDILLADDGAQIRLSPEMLPFEHKLNAVKQTLEQRKTEAACAEQRKDELVMYLAHDIRTPLTSVIGYLNLLQESPDMSREQRAKSLQITLEKAYRLEEMINELFEITRYHSHQTRLFREPLDLSFMLVQLSDELLPLFARRGNTIVLDVEDNLGLYADADKLARVFGNILKNAAAYSHPETEINISAHKSGRMVHITFQNQGPAIPAEKLATLFDKFYRLDEARKSDTGGAGLGLAIAKEIVLLHDGSIRADCSGDTITFTVELPAADSENLHKLSGSS